MTASRSWFKNSRYLLVPTPSGAEAAELLGDMRRRQESLPQVSSHSLLDRMRYDVGMLPSSCSACLLSVPGRGLEIGLGVGRLDSGKVVVHLRRLLAGGN